MANPCRIILLLLLDFFLISKANAFVVVERYGSLLSQRKFKRLKASATTTTSPSTLDGSSREPRSIETNNDAADALDASNALYKVQEQMLVDRGRLEEEMMKNNYSPLETIASPSSGDGFAAGGGFGAANKNKKDNIRTLGKHYAKELQRHGVVRIDNVLEDEMADELRNCIFELKDNALKLVESNNDELEMKDCFANVLLKSNRFDFKVPLGPLPIMKALKHTLGSSSIVKETMKQLLGPQATLYELASLISNPGSDRQVIHPDHPCQIRSGLREEDPTLLTCFIALQNIDMEMGPTVFLPGTHRHDIHVQFKDEEPRVVVVENNNDDETTTTTTSKDELLKSRPAVLGILPKGSCTIFDSRLLHCGSANRHETKSRALFYFSFKHPLVGYPGNAGSLRKELEEANLSLETLSKELSHSSSQKQQGGNNNKKSKKSKNAAKKKKQKKQTTAFVMSPLLENIAAAAKTLTATITEPTT